MLEPYRYHAGKFPVHFHVFELTGSDVQDFLQNQSTYNFKNLSLEHFHLVSFLDPQGRVEFYAWALKSESSTKLLTPLTLRETAFQRLEKYLISEDVTISDRGEQVWTFVIGPMAKKSLCLAAFEGLMVEEPALLMEDASAVDLPTITAAEMKIWLALNGWPDFAGLDFSSEIINNLRLYDLSVGLNKGCYPGQETVSKIATRRGAAYSPVLLKTSKPQHPGEIFLVDKKIGEIFSCFEWEGEFYSVSKLLRDFRIEGLKVNYSLEAKECEATVYYYPLLTGSSEEKAKSLFYEGSDYFKVDNLKMAEQCFRLSLELDPLFADSYEALGVMLGRQERYSEAIELMDKLSQIDSSSVLAHTNKSLFLMKMGKIDEAEEQKSLATVKSFQKFGDEAKLKERVLQEQKKQEEEWTKRESMFQQVLEIDQEDTLANYGIGSIAVEKKHWDKAVAHLEKVLVVDPNYSVAYLALGKAYKAQGHKEKAISTWKEGMIIAAKKGDLMPANQMQVELQNL
jgi:tetratricopeptide (TPR) repeat protein